MKRDIVAKRAIQTVACGFGLLGLLSVWMGVHFLVTGVGKAEWSTVYFMAPLFLSLGGIGIAIAWQPIGRFGPNAIRNVAGFFMFLGWSELAWFPESSQHSEPRWRSDLLETTLALGSLCLAFLLCRILSRKLIRMTGPVGSGGGPLPATDPHKH